MTAAALPASVLPRLGSLLRLLASDQEGEVLGAARAIGRVLASVGLGLHDLAAAVERSADRGSRPGPREECEPGVRHDGTWVYLDDLRRAEAVLALRRGLAGRALSTWECAFASSMISALGCGGRLTERQWAKLRDVLAKAGEG